MVCNSLVAFSCTALTIANNVEDFSVLKPLLVAYARVLKYRSTRMALRVFSSASNSLNNAAMSLRMAKEGRCEDRLEVREKEGGRSLRGWNPGAYSLVIPGLTGMFSS